MCGGTDKATKAAQTREDERRIQVANATAAIERAFGGEGRQGQLEDFVNALREQFGTEAGRQRKDIGRRSKFALARSGLTGGSAAADIGVDIGRQFQGGILEGERLSQSALADLTSADVRSKQNLIALAQGGAGVSSGARQAAEALKSNLAGARSRIGSESLGDIFSESEDILLASEKAAGRRRGLAESDIFADPFSRSS